MSWLRIIVLGVWPQEERKPPVSCKESSSNAYHDCQGCLCVPTTIVVYICVPRIVALSLPDFRFLILCLVPGLMFFLVLARVYANLQLISTDFQQLKSYVCSCMLVYARWSHPLAQRDVPWWSLGEALVKPGLRPPTQVPTRPPHQLGLTELRRKVRKVRDEIKVSQVSMYWIVLNQFRSLCILIGMVCIKYLCGLNVYSYLIGMY